MKTGKIGIKEIRIIHVAKSQLIMGEEEYRSVLKSFDVSTSKDLTYFQYRELLRKFQADGFILTGGKNGSYRNHSAANWEKKPMLKKIGALLFTMNLSWKYADGIARRMYKVDAVSWCNPAQLHSIVAALEYKRRKGEKNGGLQKISNRKEKTLKDPYQKAN